MAQYEIDETKLFSYFTGSIPFGGVYDSDTTDVKITNVLTATGNDPDQLYEDNPWYVCNKYIRNFALQKEVVYDLSNITAWNDYTNTMSATINTKQVDYVLSGIVSTYDTQYNSYFNNIPEQTYAETAQGVSKAGFLRFAPKDFYYEIKYLWVTAKDTFAQSRVTVDVYKQNQSNMIITGIIAYLRNKNTNKYVCCKNTNWQAGMCFQPIIELSDGEHVSHIYAPFFTANNQVTGTGRPYNVNAEIPFHYIFSDTASELIEPCTLEYTRANGIQIETFEFSTIAIQKRKVGNTFVLDFVNGFTEDQMLKYAASFGFYFSYNGDMYMPIVHEGYVTRGEYVTGDLIDSTDSLLKDMTASGGNDINPEYSSDEDDVSDIQLLDYPASVNGFVKYYAMTTDELQQLNTALHSDEVPAGFDFAKSIVSLQEFPADLLTYALTGPAAAITIAGYNTGVSALPVTGFKHLIHAASITIPTRYNNSFLDYEPYTTAQIYVPLCGVVDLPLTHCMSRTIDIYIAADVECGSLRAVIKCGDIIAESAGNCTSEMMLSSDNAGIKKSAILQSGLQVGASGLGMLGSAAMGNALGLGVSAVAFTSAFANALSIDSKNFMSYQGSSTAMCSFVTTDCVVLKLTQPRALIPEGYGHTRGYVCDIWAAVADMSGFTVFDNFDTSGLTATQAEKDEIKRLMESGVFL